MNELKSIEDLESALAASKQFPIFLYKHSTVCPISASAHERVRDHIRAKGAENLPPFHLVKVIESRPLSNELADRLGVRHESPQLILVKDGAAAANTSHREITGRWIDDSIAALP